MAEQTTQNITIQTEGKNLLAAYVIWFFLGTLGIHRIYIGRKGSGITMLVIFVLSLLSMIIFVGALGFLVLGVWWLVDAALIPGMVESAKRGGRFAPPPPTSCGHQS
jgi:TM2 domain-containing membrane protein YozV